MQTVFFEMDKEQAMQILKLIEETYIYDKDTHFNYDRKNDIKEMLCALEYCTAKSDGRLYALHRTNRNMNRIRENGGWIDAPDDGRTDTTPSREKAIDRPVLMFLRQNGAKTIEDGKNIGWNDAPFYWPVLMTQQNIGTVMYALDQSRKGQVEVVDLSDFYEGINPEEVLSMTYAGDLVAHFGEEGSEQEELETRQIKETTATKYLMKNEKGGWLLNPDVSFDAEHDHGVYSANNGEFPFVLRPYKYMLLRNKRDITADVILLELAPKEEWGVIEEPEFNDDGDLIDKATKEVLVRASDVLRSKDMTERDFKDETVTQWTIIYKIKKVLKFRRGIHNSTDETENEE